MLEQYIANDYLRAGLILVGVFLILRIVVFLIERVFVQVTKKTKTDLDDILLKKASKPLTIIVFLVGVRWALVELPLTEYLQNIIYQIVFSIIVVFLAYLAYHIIDLFVMRAWKKLAKKTKSKVDDGLVNLVQGTLKVVLVVFVILYVLNFWGVKVGPFLAGLGIAGLAIAFALQSSLSNIFSGISIILDKTVRVGDLVYLADGTKGKIIQIGLRSTRIHTFDDELVIVPNSNLANNNVQNIALPEPKVRVAIPFGVAYGSDVDKVKKLILKEIKKVTGILDDPEPYVKFLEMGDSSLNFKAYFFIKSYEQRLTAIDEANTIVYNALNKAKISIPFPQMDVHLKKRK